MTTSIGTYKFTTEAELEKFFIKFRKVEFPGKEIEESENSILTREDMSREEFFFSNRFKEVYRDLGFDETEIGTSIFPTVAPGANPDLSYFDTLVDDATNGLTEVSANAKTVLDHREATQKDQNEVTIPYFKGEIGKQRDRLMDLEIASREYPVNARRHKSDAVNLQLRATRARTNQELDNLRSQGRQLNGEITGTRNGSTANLTMANDYRAQALDLRTQHDAYRPTVIRRPVQPLGPGGRPIPARPLRPRVTSLSRGLPPLPQRGLGGLVQAKYDYNTTAAGDLSFKKGDRFRIIEGIGPDANWRKVEPINGQAGVQGYIPSNYIQQIASREDLAAPTAGAGTGEYAEIPGGAAVAPGGAGGAGGGVAPSPEAEPAVAPGEIVAPGEAPGAAPGGTGGAAVAPGGAAVAPGGAGGAGGGVAPSPEAEPAVAPGEIVAPGAAPGAAPGGTGGTGGAAQPTDALPSGPVDDAAYLDVAGLPTDALPPGSVDDAAYLDVAGLPVPPGLQPQTIEVGEIRTIYGKVLDKKYKFDYYITDGITNEQNIENLAFCLVDVQKFKQEAEDILSRNNTPPNEKNYYNQIVSIFEKMDREYRQYIEDLNENSGGPAAPTAEGAAEVGEYIGVEAAAAAAGAAGPAASSKKIYADRLKKFKDYFMKYIEKNNIKDISAGNNNFSNIINLTKDNPDFGKFRTPPSFASRKEEFQERLSKFLNKQGFIYMPVKDNGICFFYCLFAIYTCIKLKDPALIREGSKDIKNEIDLKKKMYEILESDDDPFYQKIKENYLEWQVRQIESDKIIAINPRDKDDRDFTMDGFNGGAPELTVFEQGIVEIDAENKIALLSLDAYIKQLEELPVSQFDYVILSTDDHFDFCTKPDLLPKSENPKAFSIDFCNKANAAGRTKLSYTDPNYDVSPGVKCNTGDTASVSNASPLKLKRTKYLSPTSKIKKARKNRANNIRKLKVKK